MLKKSRVCVLRFFLGGLALCACAGPAAAQAVGTQYDSVTLDFQGDATYDETSGRADPNAEATSVNPFLDRELEVTFTHTDTGTSYVVPGFFDGDGSGGGTGNVFRTRFTPDRPGAWTYTASFTAGKNVAIGEVAGNAVNGGSFANGRAAGTLTVAPAPQDAPGFHAKGRLLYNDAGDDLSKHYLRFQNGDYFLKGGADSPENFLGFSGFDNTQTKGDGPGNEGIIHNYAPHAGDYDNDGPVFNGSNGANITGAVNYLASRNVNSVYFLPMNIGGDGKETHPFANISTPAQLGGSPSNDNAHYDISKLTQWEQLFGHMQDQGLLLHMVLNEAEALNKRELDNAELGPERKLFYRELIARFGHHNALQWNLSEEYNRDLNLGAGEGEGVRRVYFGARPLRPPADRAQRQRQRLRRAVRHRATQRGRAFPRRRQLRPDLIPKLRRARHRRRGRILPSPLPPQGTAHRGHGRRARVARHPQEATAITTASARR